MYCIHDLTCDFIDDYRKGSVCHAGKVNVHYDKIIIEIPKKDGVKDIYMNFNLMNGLGVNFIV